MADEQPTSAPAEPQAPGAAPEPTPIPTPPAGPVQPSELDQLRSEHLRTREELAAANATLRLLAPQPPPQDRAIPIVRLPPADARAIAQSLGGGWTEDAVQQHVP